MFEKFRVLTVMINSECSCSYNLFAGQEVELPVLSGGEEWL
jgi:hypothetical protein